MKKVMLGAFVAGMLFVGSVYAQTTATPATGQPATKHQSVGGDQTDKSAKHHHKGKGKKHAGTTKAATSPKTDSKTADQK